MSLRPSDDAEPPQITSALRLFYDAEADRRDRLTRQDWKLDERAAFLDRLRAAEARTLLEVGAGTGQDSEFFAREGLEVTAIDLSPAMVQRSRAKGIHGRVQDVRDLRPVDGTFDAVYAFNSMLHVPNADLPSALAAVGSVLRPGGLFYLGVYGGAEPEEGFSEDERFFSFRSDHDLLAYGKEVFDILDFHVIHDEELRFQSLTLVRP